MRRGIGTLEVALLTAAVMVSAALLGSIFLQPGAQRRPEPVVAIYGVTLLGPQYSGATPLSAAEQCAQVAEGLYGAGLLSKPEPLELGEGGYAYAVVLRVLQPGVISGVKISSYAGSQLYKVVEERLNLAEGRYLLCLYTDRYYANAKIELLGATNLCVDCLAR
ncbi:MAG: hypothetical protein GXO07_05630 [Crenarchaeota archaeon]|nr:hypothetical protein [Thermoproteota archaeon]